MKINLSKNCLKICLLSLLTISSVSAVSSPAELCVANGIDYQSAVSFANNVKENINAHDKQKMAASIHYPLQVNQRTPSHKLKSVTVKNEKEFLNNYSTIITPRIINIMKGSQNPNVFCNAQGASFANGAIWFNPGKQGIFVINS